MPYQDVAPETKQNPKLPAKHLVDLLNANVNNEKLSDEDFRKFIRNSLPLYS